MVLPEDGYLTLTATDAGPRLSWHPGYGGWPKGCQVWLLSRYSPGSVVWALVEACQQGVPVRDIRRTMERFSVTDSDIVQAAFEQHAITLEKPGDFWRAEARRGGKTFTREGPDALAALANLIPDLPKRKFRGWIPVN